MESNMENMKISNRGFELSCELKNVPVAFVNAIRRILLSAIPTVVIRDIQILDNTTQMPHEMLKHRVEMLPINVSPDDATTERATTSARARSNPRHRDGSQQK